MALCCTMMAAIEAAGGCFIANGAAEGRTYKSDAYNRTHH
jgi:hypothetical protein